MGRVKPTSMELGEAARILRASYAALPPQALMDSLLADSHAAQARGYYDPLEDERLRDSFANYLAARVSIWQMIQALRPRFKTQAASRVEAENLSPAQKQAFAIAFCGAEIIVSTGEYLIDLASKRDIVWQKLDEAEMRYGLERKSFTRLYRQLTSAYHMTGFYKARDYYDTHREALLNALRGEENFPQIADILEQLNTASALRGDHLRRYRRFVNFSLRRRGFSTGRKTMFALFETMGSDIAELKIPLVKNVNAPKRVSADIIKDLKPKLRAGDVIITRHDDAMSNLFLPGFWPHGALYIGGDKARADIGLAQINSDFAHMGAAPGGSEINIIEAKKDGVLLRPVEDTLQVDAFVVLRPNLPQAQIAKALTRAISHAGKLYDFVFDFATSERLVCTEVVYRAYHGADYASGKINFELSAKAGRKCLSAEDFLNQGIAHGWFEPVMIYGVPENRLISGKAAKTLLEQSFQSKF